MEFFFCVKKGEVGFGQVFGSVLAVCVDVVFGRRAFLDANAKIFGAADLEGTCGFVEADWVVEELVLLPFGSNRGGDVFGSATTANITEVIDAVDEFVDIAVFEGDASEGDETNPDSDEEDEGARVGARAVSVGSNVSGLRLLECFLDGFCSWRRHLLFFLFF